MQRCPYLHEMKERLLGSQRGDMALESFERERDALLDNSSRPGSNQVGTVATVVKVRVSSFDTPEKIQVISNFLMISFKLFSSAKICFLVFVLTKDQNKVNRSLFLLLNVFHKTIYGLFPDI